MSDPIGASVEFAAPFSLGNVTKLIECVRAAVLENWEKHADLYSTPTPNLEELDLPAAAMQVVDEIESGKHELDSGSRASSTAHFSYSPLSVWVPYLTFWRQSDGTMRICLTILSSSPPCERQGDRERRRMEWEWEEERKRRGIPYNPYSDGWPEEGNLDEDVYDAWWKKWHSLGKDHSPSVWQQNRQSFLNIINHVKKALPVKAVQLDPPFL